MQKSFFNEISGRIQQGQNLNFENQFISLDGSNLQALYYFSFVPALLLHLPCSCSRMVLSILCSLL